MSYGDNLRVNWENVKVKNQIEAEWMIVRSSFGRVNELLTKGLSRTLSKIEPATQVISSRPCGDDYNIFKYQSDEFAFKYVLCFCG